MTANRTLAFHAFRALAPLVLPLCGQAQDPPRRIVVPQPPAQQTGTGFFRNAFIRDQTLLGLLVYAPTFATTVTTDPAAWGAAWIVVGAGSYIAASELSRQLVITAPTQWLATQTAVRGGIAGWALAYAGDASRPHRAAGIFFGSIGGTAAALAFGRGMTDGEVAATTFGADLAAVTGFGLTAMAGREHDARSRAGTMAVAGLAGYPLGYFYASRARYRVSPGDVTTLWTSAAIGAMAGATFIANGASSRETAVALTAGALAGTVLGDRFLVRPFDHSPEDGQVVALAAAAGGLMGAGVGVLTGAAHERVSAGTAALTAIGAIAGVAWAEHYVSLPAAPRKTLARLRIDPLGILAAASGQAGTHSFLRLTF